MKPKRLSKQKQNYHALMLFVKVASNCSLILWTEKDEIMSILLEGAKILVVGASSGIGLETVRILNSLKCNIVASSRSILDVGTPLSEMRHVSLVKADISKATECRDLFDTSSDALGGLDIVINTSGVHAQNRRFVDLTLEDVQLIYETNTLGVFNLLKCADIYFSKMSKIGHVIQVSSVAGEKPSILAGCAYTGSKHAINGMIKTISQEPEKNIKVSMVSPGPTETPLVDSRKVPPTSVERKKLLSPSCIAHSIVFTASQPKGTYVENITILPTGEER